MSTRRSSAGLMHLDFKSKAKTRYDQIKTVVGLCLVGKKSSSGTGGLCTGSVVSFRESIVLVTSETIIQSEELAKVKQSSSVWNKGDYVLCFKSRKKDKNKPKIYNLNDITESNGEVNFDQGLVMVHLDSEKLSGNFKQYRPFKANDNKITDPNPFNGSICRMVNGNAKSFEVESYDIIHDTKCGKDVLELRSSWPPHATFDTWSTLTSNGAVRDRLASGGGIFKSGAFVGVLIFDGHDLGQIVPVQCWLGKLVGKYCRVFEGVAYTLEMEVGIQLLPARN